MSFRVSALVAVVGVLVLGSVSPAFGQPVPPPRPRTQPFGAIFSPPLQQQQLQQQLALNQAMGVGGIAPRFFGQGFGNPLFFGGAPGINYGPLAYQSAFPGVFDPAVGPTVTTGVVGTFGNYGHWYPNGVTGGNYGHWYPNGVANGRGVLGYGGVSAGGPAIAGGGTV
jgi:hypothetical protein